MKIFKREYDHHYFENIAYREAANSQRNRKRLKEILRFKQKGRLLEIGCGTGGLLRLAAQYFEITGMDISDYAVDKLRSTIQGEIINANIEDAELKGNDQDVVVAFNVLEHLQRPGVAIDRIYHALRSPGILIGSVPLNAAWIGRLYTALTNIFDRTHLSTHSPASWLKLFADAGFCHTHFFGEVVLGRNRCWYLRNPYWRHMSLNLMFVCEK